MYNFCLKKAWTNEYWKWLNKIFIFVKKVINLKYFWLKKNNFMGLNDI